MIDQISLYIGYTVLIVGGTTLAILALATICWITFEYVVRRFRYLKRIVQWREAAKREVMGG